LIICNLDLAKFIELLWPGLVLGVSDIPGYLDDNGEQVRFTFITDVYQKNTNELIVPDQKNHCLRKIER